MKTNSKKGVRKFDFSKLEREQVDAAISIFDDMARYPEDFPDANEGYETARECRKKMGGATEESTQP